MDPHGISVRVVASREKRANGRMALEVTLSDGAHSVSVDGLKVWIRPPDAELQELFEQWLRQARNGVTGYVEL